MKKILCLAVVMLASATVFAQEKTIQPAEFETISQSSSRMLSGAARRIIRTQQSTVEVISQTKDTGKTAKTAPSTVSVKSVIEVLPSVGYRSVYEFNSASKNTKKETIKIANRVYEREGNGDWSEISVPKAFARADNATRKIDNTSRIQSSRQRESERSEREHLRENRKKQVHQRQR